MSPPPDAEARAPGRPSLPVELLVLMLGIAAFVLLHAATARDAAAATANAHALQSLERALGLDVERATNEWLAGSATALQVAAVYVYRSYYLVVVGVLVWVYVRHAEVYLRVRRTLLAMFLLVLPIYWAVPMSPPRFASPGVVDVVAVHDPFGSRSGWTQTTGQSLTAMPSMHVALSAWCAYAVWTALRSSHRRLALLPWLFPLVMTAVVLTTGNHYVLDVVGSAVLLAASIGVASVWGRLADRRRSGAGSSG